MTDAGDRLNARGPGEVTVSLSGVDQFALLGWHDANLKVLEESFGGGITVRGDVMTLRGDPEETAAMGNVVCRLIDMLAREKSLDTVAVHYVIEQLLRGDGEGDETPGAETLFVSGNRRAVRAKTLGQQAYVEAVRAHDLVFAIGPAGTGKTYLAVVMAMDYLKRGLVERVILVRPAVEAGEQLGFLPGDLQEKIDPYLRPLYDALSDTIGPSRIQRYMSTGVIEAAPLAYMRGRTLNQAFVILDEAQNTTLGQLKMFLTRLGHQAKAVVTGDITQIDLVGGKESGLVRTREILAGTEGVAFVELTRRDVVRHPLVRRIVEAFRVAEEKDVKAQKRRHR